MRPKPSALNDAIREYVEPGMHLNFASTPSRSNAGVRELARVFRGRAPGFEISATGFHSHAHLLAMLRLGRRYVTCFVGDNYPVSRPNALYSALRGEGATFELWSLFSYVSALRAGALGHPYAFTRSLVGSDMAADLEKEGAFRPLPSALGEPDSIGLVRALRPDVTFVHAPMGDSEGNLYFSPPYSEGLWGAHGASRGVIATVERLVDPSDVAELTDAVRFPGHRVLAVCVEPFGAHPQPLYVLPRFDSPGYVDDFDHYEKWREISAGGAAAEAFTTAVLDAEDGGRGYRAWVGVERLEQLVTEARDVLANIESAHARGVAPSSRRARHHPPRPEEDGGRVPPLGPRATRDSQRPDAPARANEIMLVLAARKIAERVQAGKYPVILAGIGHSFLAARMAAHALAEAGTQVKVLVETGLIGLECGPTADEFLLSFRNSAFAQGLSSVEDALGTLTCGAQARCLGVLGAAQVDATGALNSTRVADKWLVGSGGANDIASCAAEVVVLARSGATRLAPKVDYLTSPGRAVLTVATDMCVFSRDSAKSTTWAVEDIYPVLGGRPPAFVLSAIRESCSWPLRVPEDAEYAPLISTKEMALIHSLDPEGIHWHRDHAKLG